MSLVALPVDSRLTFASRHFGSGEDPLASGLSSPMMFDGEFCTLEEPNEALSPRSQGSKARSPVTSSNMYEHRELKRLHDRARRDSQLSARMRRYSSTSYGEQPPMGSVDPMSNMGISGYQTAASDTMSMLGESPSSMAVSPYAPPYSPAMSYQSVPGQSCQMPYQQPLPQNYNIPMDYQNYISTGAFSPKSSSTPRQASVASVPTTQSQGSSFVYDLPSPKDRQKAPESVPQTNGNIRVVQGRPKPRCWEHGCNGRQFSTFSNLLRHQREKSGQAAKSSCPNCGAEFTRTTARNGHMLHEKCKRRNTTSS